MYGIIKQVKTVYRIEEKKAIKNFLNLRYGSLGPHYSKAR